jgi:hypothetical protein
MTFFHEETIESVRGRRRSRKTMSGKWEAKRETFKNQGTLSHLSRKLLFMKRDHPSSQGIFVMRSMGTVVKKVYSLQRNPFNHHFLKTGEESEASLVLPRRRLRTLNRWSRHDSRKVNEQEKVGRFKWFRICNKSQLSVQLNHRMNQKLNRKLNQGDESRVTLNIKVSWAWFTSWLPLLVVYVVLLTHCISTQENDSSRVMLLY